MLADSIKWPRQQHRGCAPTSASRLHAHECWLSATSIIGCIKLRAAPDQLQFIIWSSASMRCVPSVNVIRATMESNRALALRRGCMRA